MFRTLKKLAYGARVLMSRSGELEMIDVAGKPTQMRHAGEGPPFFYLHSALGETVWLPFLEKWSKQFEVFAPAHPGFANLGGVSLGGWIAVEFATRWPERVSHLWLCNTPGLWLDDHPYFDLFRHAEDVDALRKAIFHDQESYQATMILKDREEINEETLITIFQSMTVLARLVWER